LWGAGRRQAARSLGAGPNLLGDGVERRAGVLAEGRNGHQADHDDQRQHHGVFDCRRAVFTLHEVDNRQTELTHDLILSKTQGRSRESIRSRGMRAHELVPICWATVLKVALAFLPRAVIATRQTTMISDSITAYSTAVGP